MTPGPATKADKPSPAADRLALRRFYVAMLYALAALWGAGQVIFAQQALPYVLSALLFATAATLWAVTDSKIRARPLLPVVRLVFFLTWPIATCLYLMATRGWRGFGWWLLHALGLTLTTSLTFYPTALLLYPDWLE